MTSVPGADRFSPASRVIVEGVGINYEYEPALDGADRALVFIHGYGATLQSWNDVWPLRPRDWAAYRLDLKGFGFSDIPDDGAYTPQDQARIADAFVSTIPEREVVLVGHSCQWPTLNTTQAASCSARVVDPLLRTV